jgi:hypothetical protein
MNTNEQDFSFLKQALPQLQEYLLSNELYWPLGAAMPRLTPGSLLLAIARVSVFQSVESSELHNQLDEIRKKWRSAWEKKVGREIASRLRLWSQFLADYSNSPDQNVDSYPSEIRGRVILQLLLDELPDCPDRTAIEQLDPVLRAHLLPGKFLWDAQLQVVFPVTDFWFLYGKLNI